MKVRIVIRKLRDDGWYLDRTSGSHRQFAHDKKPGIVTVSGHDNDDLPTGTLDLSTSRLGALTMRYAVIIENAGRNLAAYVPDLPGCIATGANRDEVEHNIAGAIAFHLEGMRARGLSIPEPMTIATDIEVPAA